MLETRLKIIVKNTIRVRLRVIIKSISNIFNT